MSSGERYRVLTHAKGRVLGFFEAIIGHIPYFRFIRDTADTQVPITLGKWWQQVVLKKYGGVYWPIHPTSVVEDFQNVLIGVHTNPGYAPQCHIQGKGGVYIGDYTHLSRNVRILSGHSDPKVISTDLPQSVRIGKFSWIGMNSVLLPGVELGDFTIVAPGTLVTQSFPEGYCVISGHPASVTRRLDPGQCVRYNHPHEYVGFLKKKDFESYRRRKLRV